MPTPSQHAPYKTYDIPVEPISRAFREADPEASESSASCSCEIDAVSADREVTCLNKPVTFTAEGECLKDVTWSGGGDPATGTGTTFTTKWDTSGTKLVIASCEGDASSESVNVVDVSFGSDLIRTGYTIPVSQSTIGTSGFLTCDPPEFVNDITLSVSGVDRVNITITERIPETGYLTFFVKGKSATPSTKPEGDTFIEAKLGEHVCAKIPAVVVVPKRIHKPYPQANGNVVPQNLVLDASTTPAWWGLPAGQVQLVTAWTHWMTVTVEDQFGDVLDALYSGVDIYEKMGSWRDINQDLSGSGTYQDPVGVVRFPATPTVPAGSPAAVSWPTDPTLAMGQVWNINQNIPVKVGGHGVGTIRRKVTGTPPNHVKIVW